MRSVGGIHVDLEKRSTNLRTKNLGKVPPRLDTLEKISQSTAKHLMTEKKTHVAKSVM